MTSAQTSGAEPAPPSALTPAMAPDAFSSMFQSIAGLRNLRAAAAMLGCFVAGVLVAGLLGYLGRGSFVVTGLAGLLGALLFFTGIHAAGVLLMDQARRLPPRSVMDAVVYGLMCVPKTIALIVLMVLAVIALYVVMWLLFLVCKIPGLGPVLFTVVFPACVLLAGLTVVGMMISLQMALPALWEGAGVTAALAKAFAILRSRLVETVMLLAVVAVLSGFVFAFVGAVLMFGFFPAMGLAATSIGSFGSSMGGGAGMYGGGMGGGVFGSMMGGLMQGGMGGYAIAGGLGSGLLWAVAMTLVFQVSLLGANLAYLRVSEGIDSSGAERAMHERLEQAKRKAAEMGQQAKEAAERARAQAAQAAEQRRAVAAAAAAPAVVAAPAVAPSPPAMASTCPQCHAAVGAQDQFCGECGFRLR
jgi:hypothetical protein